MKRQENRTVIAWRGAASAGLISSADRAYMKAPSLVPRRTSGQNRGVDKPCPPCPYYGKIKEKYGGSTYDDADGQ